MAQNNNTQKKNLPNGCLTLIALPFIGIGIWALVTGASTLLQWSAAKDWVATPARLTSVALEEHRGDDSTTYETTATYRYEYEGQTYTGTRVGLDSGADNIGDYQQRLYDQLRAARESDRPITVYVNPSDPADARIDRELRTGMLSLQVVFAMIFGGLGGFLVIAARTLAKEAAAARVLRARFPNEPWRWRPAWGDGRIKAKPRTGAHVAIAIGIVWNLLAWPAAGLAAAAVAGGNAVAIVAFVFPLTGVALGAWAVRAWLQLRRFKVPTLTLERMPVALGARLKAQVRVDAAVAVASDFALELECVEERISGSGKHRRRHERLLWQKQWRVPRHQCQVGADLTTIPVDVAVPAELPATTIEDISPKIIWRLEVAGQCPGPDFWSRFDLPVFAVGSQVDAGDAPPAVAPSASERPDARTLSALGIDYERLTQGGEAWTFRRGRRKHLAATVTLLTLLWTAGLGVLLARDGSLPLTIVFVLFELLLVWYALELWLTEYRVTLARGILTLARHSVLPRAPIEIPQQWLRQVRVQRGMQTGNKLYYDLVVETADASHTAASGLGDYDIATWLARYWANGGAR